MDEYDDTSYCSYCSLFSSLEVLNSYKRNSHIRISDRMDTLDMAGMVRKGILDNKGKGILNRNMVDMGKVDTADTAGNTVQVYGVDDVDGVDDEDDVDDVDDVDVVDVLDAVDVVDYLDLVASSHFLLYRLDPFPFRHHYPY